MEDENPERPRVRCRCGYGKDHFMVSAELKYTAWGWFWLTLIGASAQPTKASWTCRVCREVICETEDPKELKRMRH